MTSISDSQIEASMQRSFGRITVSTSFGYGGVNLVTDGATVKKVCLNSLEEVVFLRDTLNQIIRQVEP